MCLFVLVLVKQGRFTDHCNSKPSMIVLEGDTDDSNANEENIFEANKKTDEMTGN